MLVIIILLFDTLSSTKDCPSEMAPEHAKAFELEKETKNKQHQITLMNTNSDILLRRKVG